ncbi:MAG: hypothetical protein JXA57_03425 [Armatimonadetes bacterium]|nr:hypothetical protein [Armatimonadota bacterium]
MDARETPTAGCANCPASDCPGKQEQATSPTFGRNLAGFAAGTFLAPIALAVVGSLVAGGSEARQLLGAALGFLVGLGAAVTYVRVAHSSEPDGA